MSIHQHQHTHTNAHHSHSHGSHSHSGATPNTEGSVIHWAGFYNKMSNSRLRASEETITKLAYIKPGDTVLDMGCGPGSLTIRAKMRAGQSGQVYGVDPSPEMIEVARRNAAEAGVAVNFQLGVAEALPFETGTMDVVVSRLVMHHLPGDLKQRAFAEIQRVLKPGGYCLVVDFEPPAIPVPGFVKKMLGGIGVMLEIDIRTYIPLFEGSGFTHIESGPTGHRLLSFVRGQAGGLPESPAALQGQLAAAPLQS
jgi:demethylmenaquinone methyltransferase/2-methoxy-6-polyprenyl-1,4-benzoquinol methylase/phosphoethanolamine N-methyltransferase